MAGNMTRPAQGEGTPQSPLPLPRGRSGLTLAPVHCSAATTPLTVGPG
jgi:hypothetical protein